MGGGLGVRYVASDDPPTIAAWVQTVSAAVVAACRQHQQPLPRLLCEPGRSLVATAGLTLYQVGSRKEISGVRTYVAVDGGHERQPPAHHLSIPLYGLPAPALPGRSHRNCHRGGQAL